MPALFDVDLEEVAQIVERRAGEPEIPLLLDRGGFRISLRDDDSTQVRSMLSGHVLPRRLALVVAEVDLALRVTGTQENPPAIIRHLDVIEMRPAARVPADRRTQIHIGGARVLR